MQSIAILLCNICKKIQFHGGWNSEGCNNYSDLPGRYSRPTRITNFFAHTILIKSCSSQSNYLKVTTHLHPTR